MAKTTVGQVPSEVDLRLPIDPQWALSALETAEAQGALPESPGAVAGGSFHLCAAACVAYAGLRRQDEAKAKAFRTLLGATRSKQTVGDAFEELGLGQTACVVTMGLNDDTSPPRRIARMADLLLPDNVAP